MERLEDLDRHSDASATCMTPDLHTIQLEAPVWKGSHGREEGPQGRLSPPSEKHTGCDFRIPCDIIMTHSFPAMVVQLGKDSLHFNPRGA